MESVENFISKFCKAIHDGNAAIFAGAGLSRKAGFVNWKELMRSIASELDLNVDKEHDLIAIAQYHVNHKGNNRHSIDQLIVEEFDRNAESTENHKILSQLPISTYWTTNYDKLIEQSLEEAGKTAEVKITVPNLSLNNARRDAIVYKMHGDVSQPQDAVLTKDDYESYNEKRQLFTTALQGDLINKTFLFIGFSFDDPNLEYILSRIRTLLGANQRNHYCLIKKIDKKDYTSKVNNNYSEQDAVSDFNYDLAKQDLRIRDLQRYSIYSVLVEDHDDIPNILKRIEERIKRSTIFISGAAESFSNQWDKKQVNTFGYELGNRLVEKYRIVTGFGIGIGSSVLNGCLDYIFKTKYRHLDDYLVMRPFPQNIEDDQVRKKLWTKYRHEMLSHAGIAIFVFGNKIENGNVVLSEGMMEEFEIAISQGVKVIPIGATGNMAEQLWLKMESDYSAYMPYNTHIQEAMNILGNPQTKPEDLISNILKVVGLLRTI